MMLETMLEGTKVSYVGGAATDSIIPEYTTMIHTSTSYPVDSASESKIEETDADFSST
jgi:hypothetical protein